MSDENLLTKEIAEQFLADAGSVDLDDFTAVTEEAARILVGYEGLRLCLENVQSISDQALKALTHFEGSIFLGLRVLTDSVAHSIANCQGYIFPGEVLELSDRQAEILSTRFCPKTGI